MHIRWMVIEEAVFAGYVWIGRIDLLALFFIRVTGSDFFCCVFHFPTKEGVEMAKGFLGTPRGSKALKKTKEAMGKKKGGKEKRDRKTQSSISKE